MPNRRKTIVINKKFQHHYALLLVTFTIVITNLLIILRAVYPGADPFHFTLGMSVTIGLLEFVLIAATWYTSLRVTHQIAGPVYVFNREIEKFASGDYSARINLRKGDMFQEEANDINANLAKLERVITELQKVGG